MSRFDDFCSGFEPLYGATGKMSRSSSEGTILSRNTNPVLISNTMQALAALGAGTEAGSAGTYLRVPGYI